MPIRKLRIDHGLVLLLGPDLDEVWVFSELGLGRIHFDGLEPPTARHAVRRVPAGLQDAVVLLLLLPAAEHSVAVLGFWGDVALHFAPGGVVLFVAHIVTALVLV